MPDSYEMCGKKRRYKSQSRALGMAVSASKRERIMRVYRCPICKDWHLTHKPEKATS